MRKVLLAGLLATPMSEPQIVEMAGRVNGYLDEGILEISNSCRTQMVKIAGAAEGNEDLTRAPRKIKGDIVTAAAPVVALPDGRISIGVFYDNPCVTREGANFERNFGVGAFTFHCQMGFAQMNPVMGETGRREHFAMPQLVCVGTDLSKLKR